MGWLRHGCFFPIVRGRGSKKSRPRSEFPPPPWCPFLSFRGSFFRVFPSWIHHPPSLSSSGAFRSSAPPSIRFYPRTSPSSVVRNSDHFEARTVQLRLLTIRCASKKIFGAYTCHVTRRGSPNGPSSPRLPTLEEDSPRAVEDGIRCEDTVLVGRGRMRARGFRPGCETVSNRTFLRFRTGTLERDQGTFEREHLPFPPVERTVPDPSRWTAPPPHRSSKRRFSSIPLPSYNRDLSRWIDVLVRGRLDGRSTNRRALVDGRSEICTTNAKQAHVLARFQS